ncbi:MAG: hypothetical protein WCY67_07670 [Acidithiobacillus sp.]
MSRYHVIASNRSGSTADVLFKHSALGEGWQRHRVATVRWRLFQIPGRLVRHVGTWTLRFG